MQRGRPLIALLDRDPGSGIRDPRGFFLSFLAMMMLVLPVFAAAQEQEPQGLQVQISEQNPEVGERVVLTFPVPGGGELEDIAASVPSAQSSRVLFEEGAMAEPGTAAVAFRPLVAGPMRIGPITIKATPDGASDPVSFSAGIIELNVPQLAGQPDPEELRGYTPPLQLPFDYTLRNIVVAGLLLLALVAAGVLGFLLWRWLDRKRQESAKVPPRPPIEIALTQVSGLMSMNVYRSDGVERHYTLLSQALRFYMEKELQKPILEMSDDEVTEFLREHGGQRPLLQTLTPVMQRASMAKYARQLLPEDRAREDCEIAERFLLSEKHRHELAALEAQRQPQNVPATTTSAKKAA